MNKYWDSCGNNSNLWKHEWEKHGSCLKKQINYKENDYFIFNLSLFNKYINLTKNCSTKDCMLGCFDLNGHLIKCP